MTKQLAWATYFQVLTISALSQQLDELENRIQNPLILCGPLVVALKQLKQGISKRFEPLIVKPDAQLAAVVHPQFKLDWITDDAQKSALVEMLKRRVKALISCKSQHSRWSSRWIIVNGDLWCRDFRLLCPDISC